jgi:hypothetical protein
VATLAGFCHLFTHAKQRINNRAYQGSD